MQAAGSQTAESFKLQRVSLVFTQDTTSSHLISRFAFRADRMMRRTATVLPHQQASSSTSNSSRQHNEAPNQPLSLIIPANVEIVRKVDRWKNTSETLPPQFSRRQISMMSIGGVIGTGIFLGTAEALRRGGPLGMLLGYTLVGSVVYCVVVSMGEMVAYRPYIGGIVGIMDEYVDPALAFASGWIAWYHWVINCPAEISAAVLMMGFYGLEGNNAVWTTIILAVSAAINCLGARLYGDIVFWFSSIKVITIIGLVILGLALDLGAGSEGVIGFRYWNNPGPFAQYMGIGGADGRFLGFFQVLMQAVFSYLGSEIPGIAAGEVIDPSRNIPQAMKRVWIRVFLFYVCSVAVAGLIVPYNDSALNNGSKNASSSIYVIVMKRAGIKVLPHIVNAAFLTSAWSAATVDMYIASRYLWFLAYRKHAPALFRRLYKSHPDPKIDTPPDSATLPSPPPPTPNTAGLMRATLSATQSPQLRHDEPDIIEAAFNVPEKGQRELGDYSPEDAHDVFGTKQYDIEGGRCASPESERGGTDAVGGVVIPYLSVLVSCLFGLLAYTAVGKNANSAFLWLSSMTSTAALLSWAAMMYTYIRWHKGSKHAEANKYNNYTRHLDALKTLRHRGQPYLAIYALVMCTFILICNGWAILFAGSAEGKFIIAEERGELSTNGVHLNGNMTIIQQEFPPENIIPIFITTYLPIPIFLLLILGYKLINQTPEVAYKKMKFVRERGPPVPENPQRQSVLERILNWLV
ncbi:hypothetical protein BOTBODRAFT_182628 [Botryobasidium botryosum FD-172 SS1]|uniref:Amino acid permease/ SLC12A domain-containing protein n=1 Tax=Botryobasidium botryosum (strain FD-172 SS1) TaxID=930990 RepID=A0A067NBS1_BOTB1|nr:hypothetical protein BOTBODRAFT_182628 [Botryobasidium botryosum FD-172 SS1]